MINKHKHSKQKYWVKRLPFTEKGTRCHTSGIPARLPSDKSKLMASNAGVLLQSCRCHMTALASGMFLKVLHTNGAC